MNLSIAFNTTAKSGLAHRKFHLCGGVPIPTLRNKTCKTDENLNSSTHDRPLVYNPQ